MSNQQEVSLVMRTFPARNILIAATLTACIVSPALSADQRTTGCQTQGLRDLERLSPRSFAVYRAISDKSFFTRWIRCGDAQSSLPTAVHESVHFLTQAKNGYFLLNGSVLPRPRELTSFVPPKRIAGAFRGDAYVQTYLRPGAATSAEDMTYLLDELNAYTHDLNVAVNLVSLSKPSDGNISNRDGLSALMSFVMKYVDMARQQNQATWTALKRPEPQQTIRTLWQQAEKVLASSCGIPRFSVNDRQYIGFICKSSNSSALGELLGRPVACPQACLSGATASLRWDCWTSIS